MDKMPKVSIAVVGVVIAQIGGFIWWTAQQASTISNLEETVNILTVEQNKENIDEMIDILAEIYEDMEDADNDIWEEIDLVHEDVGGMASHMMEIIKVQARVKNLESTLEYLTRSPMHPDQIKNAR